MLQEACEAGRFAAYTPAAEVGPNTDRVRFVSLRVCSFVQWEVLFSGLALQDQSCQLCVPVWSYTRCARQRGGGITVLTAPQ